MAESVSATKPKVLFEITEDLLDTGLRGVPVGTCKTSAVDPDTGVSYVGYPIADLKDLPAEDVIYLIHHKSLPTKEQAAAFKADLAQRSKVPDDGGRYFENEIGVPAGYCYHCHTGRCPVGITTQDPELRKRLDPDAAAERV